MIVGVIKLGSREYLQCGDTVIPIVSITKIALDAADSGCSNQVCVFAEENHLFEGGDADDLRAFLQESLL